VRQFTVSQAGRKKRPCRAVRRPKNTPVNNGYFISDLIARSRQGDASAADELLRLAYDDLSALALSRRDPQGRPTPLNPAALVEESYLRFVSAGYLREEDRLNFVNYADLAMNSVFNDAREGGSPA
jgi:hypothetical protein